MASKFDKVRESVMEKVGELFGKMEYSDGKRISTLKYRVLKSRRSVLL